MGGMADDAFRDAVLAHPLDHAPRLVWADWLDERGDRRGAWLRHWCALENAALAVPTDPAPIPPADPPSGRWRSLTLRLLGNRGPGDASRASDSPPYVPTRAIAACCVALAALAPLPGGRRLRDLWPVGRAVSMSPSLDPAVVTTAAALLACGLSGGDELAVARLHRWVELGSGDTDAAVSPGQAALFVALPAAAEWPRPQDALHRASWVAVLFNRGATRLPPLSPWTTGLSAA
jgi:uncharacterized protein (TIGR02996 family)